MSQKGFLRKLGLRNIIESFKTAKPKTAVSHNKETQVNKRRSKKHETLRQQAPDQTQLKSEKILSDLNGDNFINHSKSKSEKNSKCVLEPKVIVKKLKISKNEESPLNVKQEAKFTYNVNKYTTITVFRDITFKFILNSPTKDLNNVEPVSKSEKSTSKNNSKRSKSSNEKKKSPLENSIKPKTGVNESQCETCTKIKLFKNKDEKIFDELVHKLKLNRSMKESKKTSFKTSLNTDEESKKVKYKIKISQVRPKKIIC
jgi:hypothetical protein